MCLNLNDYQFKTSRHSYMSACMSRIVMTNQKLIHKYTKLKIKEHKHTTKENQQTTREETKRRNEKRRTTKPGKQVIKCIKYMPINNYFEMLQSKNIGWQIGLKTKTFLYVAYKRLTSELKTETERGWKKIFHRKEITRMCRQQYSYQGRLLKTTTKDK